LYLNSFLVQLANSSCTWIPPWSNLLALVLDYFLVLLSVSSFTFIPSWSNYANYSCIWFLPGPTSQLFLYLNSLLVQLASSSCTWISPWSNWLALLVSATVTLCDSRKLWRNTKYFFAAYVGCYLQLALFLVHRFLSPWWRRF
jgi:hypothetical protein